MARKQSGNRIIVEGKETGGIFPSDREESLMEICIDGTKSAFQLSGSAFSPNLHILGSGAIRGPVFASETLRLENDNRNGPQRFSSGVR